MKPFNLQNSKIKLFLKQYDVFLDSFLNCDLKVPQKDLRKHLKRVLTRAEATWDAMVKMRFSVISQTISRPTLSCKYLAQIKRCVLNVKASTLEF